MASTLHNFINRTTIERGIEFDQAYTLTPTRTGTNSSGTFILSGNAPVYESTVGPRFGSGSWKMQVNKTVGSTRIGVESGASSADLTGFSDNNWGIGIWFKLNNVVTSQYSYENEIEILTCGGFRLSVSSSLWGSGAQGTRFMYSTNGSSYNTMQATGHTAVEAGRWYHLAVRNVSGAYTFFIDGVAVRTLSGIAAITPSTLLFGTTNSTGTGTSANITYNMSNFHYGTATQMSEEVIRGIYGVGATTAGAVYALGPESYYRFDSNDSTPDNVGATYTDAGSYLGNGSETIGTTTTPTISAGYTVITPTSSTPFRYFQGTMPWGYPANSISLFFKSASKPTGDVKFLTGGSGNYSFGSTTTESHIGSDGKLRWGGRWGSTTVYSVDSTVDICDGEWHHVVVYRDGFEIGIYIDGTLNVTQAIGTSANSADLANIQVNSIVGSTAMYIDELAIYDYRLTNANVSSIWAARPISAVNISYTAAVMTVSNATFPMPTHTAETVINVSYTSGVVGTASADIVDPGHYSDANLDAFGVVGTATADTVDSTVSVTANVDYVDGIMTASALMTTASVSTENSLTYSASPATASALLSSNVFYGSTLQDTSYNLLMRTIGATSNTEAKNGFSIGTQYTNSTVDSRTSLLLRNANGIPPYGTVIKAKFDPAWVTASSANDASPNNTFNIYVFTAAPASWTTFNYTNLPAKELISTTRLVDDASSNQFYLDITTAANDSRAYTYGIFIEHVGTPPYSGTVYDRTEFSGSALDTKLIYILTTDFVNKAINANAMTASAEQTDVTVSVQRYVNFTDGVATASADIVHPTFTAQDYVLVEPMVVTASAELIQPAFARSANYVSDHLEAFADMFGFTVHVTANVSLAIDPFLTSGLAVMPEANIGDGHFAVPFTASALFPEALVILSATTSSAVTTATTLFVDPVVSVETKGSYKAEPMLSTNAFLVNPPQFTNLFSDLWYEELYAQHSIPHGQRGFGTGAASSATAFLKLFEDTNANIIANATKLTNNLPWSIVIDTPADTTTRATYATPTNAFTTATPSPLLEVGKFDAWNRKAVRFRNTEFRLDENANLSEYNNYSLEFIVKANKSNQIFAKGEWSSATTMANAKGAIGLHQGRLYAMSSRLKSGVINPDMILANYDFYDQLTPGLADPNPAFLIGNKRIDDGQWHHVIVNYGDGRTQFWIDGKLDIQVFGDSVAYGKSGTAARIRPFILGSNSQVADAQSDFETSAWSYDAGIFIPEGSITPHYTASIKYKPVPGSTATATASMGDAKGSGNRGRALMLYWWPESTGQNTNLLTSKFDRGYSGIYDVPTFDPSLGTIDYVTSGPQQYYGWDIFPVDITGYYVSDLVNKDAYGGDINIIQGTLPGSNVTQSQIAPFQEVKINRRATFRDPITDAPRYINLTEDIDLTQFDAIFFRNFPDQSIEVAEFAGNQSVDSYFGSTETQIYNDFIKSVRDAVDEGLSLFCSSPKLAIDLGIVDRIELVSNLDDYKTLGSDLYTPTLIDGASARPIFGNAYWHDTFKNNRLRLVNTVPGLTDLPTFIKTASAVYTNDDRVSFGAPSRSYTKHEWKPNGLAVGEEFIISGELQPSGERSVAATPFANVKAGTIVTAFANNYRRGTELIANPYSNYAVSIAVSPGDVLNGRQVGGKIFVNFTENGEAWSDDFGQADLIQDYWINLAYDQGSITLARRNELLASPSNIDRQLEAGTITSTKYNKLAYWSSNGDYTISSADQVIEIFSDAGRTSDPKGQDKATLKKFNSKGQAINTTQTYTTNQFFTFKYSREFPTTTFNAYSWLTRGFLWISEKTVDDGLVYRPVAKTALASMVDPVVSADKILTANVQPMLASASLNVAQYTNEAKVLAFPMEARAEIINTGTKVAAAVMTASALTRQDIAIFTSSIDEVILYINHTDPILYLREEVIK